MVETCNEWDVSGIFWEDVWRWKLNVVVENLMMDESCWIRYLIKYYYKYDIQIWFWKVGSMAVGQKKLSVEVSKATKSFLSEEKYSLVWVLSKTKVNTFSIYSEFLEHKKKMVVFIFE